MHTSKLSNSRLAWDPLVFVGDEQQDGLVARQRNANDVIILAILHVIYSFHALCTLHFGSRPRSTSKECFTLLSRYLIPWSCAHRLLPVSNPFFLNITAVYGSLYVHTCRGFFQYTHLGNFLIIKNTLHIFKPNSETNSAVREKNHPLENTKIHTLTLIL